MKDSLYFPTSVFLLTNCIAMKTRAITLVGAVSGEIASIYATPKGSQSQAKGQKKIDASECVTHLMCLFLTS